MENIRYSCKYKHSKALQEYIFNKYNIGWLICGKKYLNFNDHRNNRKSTLKQIEDDDIIVIEVNEDEEHLTFSTFQTQYVGLIDFDMILRKLKLKELQKKNDII